ncbi:MAG: helix-turn-helix domain-containing protein [Acidobacteria bacterium]|nr:helix-turn-helix domain-containing protein [Acidobacteriota bacterium]
MVLDHAACCAAIQARDARFDGVFFTAVKSTGVYCRPVCPARTPKPVNCVFYETAAAAEAAGFRPCLRCRPERSPAAHDGDGSLARRFLSDVQRDGLFGASVEQAANRLGVSSRHLRRAVERECGVTPVGMIRTTRLLFARRLLTETRLPISAIAFGSGFGSLARFNHCFRAHYGVAPSAFRVRASRPPAASLRLTLAWREPFAWDALVRYWSTRAIPGVERVEGARYSRTVRYHGCRGWISASPAKGAVELTVSDSLAACLLPVAGQVRAMFDLDANPHPIAAALGADPLLAPLVRRTPGLRVPGAFDGFELALRAILGQQVTVAAATTLAGRLIARFAEPAEGAPHGLTHYPVEPAALAEADPAEIARIGIPGARAATIHAVAERAASGALDFHHPTARTLSDLRAIRGIGQWTCDYLAMRLLRWPDAFPEGDLGLRKAIAPATPREASERWRPWRAYAALYLWTA